jgi:hypothetical protein
MINGSPSFKFAGHALGVSAHFTRLDETEGLNHVVPTLGTSVLRENGQRASDYIKPYRFEVDAPRKRCLLSVERVDTWAEGRAVDDRFETEVSIDIGALDVVEMLHIDLLRLHMHSSRTATTDPSVTTQGNRIEGMRLGKVEARVTIDDEPLTFAGTEHQLVDFHQRKAQELPKYGDRYRCSLVKEIQLIGSEKDQHGMCVLGNVIVWKGFGRIILGEINVKGHERQLTLVRLAMGSSAGGTAAAGDGQSNGQPIVT